ncbi:serine/arginine repetitive matrix protein 1-like [Pongo abelii]|uniref:serine/arginine repetitive matrix protein 1-like n=1 Tax=Pongo abelii TaxID=9601 RepID=UPI0023E8F4BB|nr:serine/arginine repetitive matrix protein 1-like [Pongo abelii]
MAAAAPAPDPRPLPPVRARPPSPARRYQPSTRVSAPHASCSSGGDRSFARFGAAPPWPPTTPAPIGRDSQLFSPRARRAAIRRARRKSTALRAADSNQSEASEETPRRPGLENTSSAKRPGLGHLRGHDGTSHFLRLFRHALSPAVSQQPSSGLRETLSDKEEKQCALGPQISPLKQSRAEGWGGAGPFRSPCSPSHGALWAGVKVPAPACPHHIL